MYLNVFAAHCSKMIRTVIMVRVCECGCVNARTKFEAQGLTILTCETCQHAHGRMCKCEKVGMYGIYEMSNKLQQAAATCSKLRQAAASCSKLLQAATSCSKVQQAATSCNKLRQAAASCNKPRQAAASCSKLRQAAATCSKLRQAVATCSKLRQAAASCSKPRQAATSYKTSTDCTACFFIGLLQSEMDRLKILWKKS